MPQQIRLAIGIPAYGGQVSAAHAQMWLELGAMLRSSNERFVLGMMGYADVNGVDRARNYLVAAAMIKNCDWLLMVDADTFVEADRGAGDADAGFMLLRMISDAARVNATIVSAPVIRRVAASDKREFAVYRQIDPTEGRPSGHEPMLKAEMITSLSAATGPLHEVFAVGAACMAIDLHKIGDSMFKFTETLSEDLEFCRQIRELGGKILVDKRVRTGHMSRPFPLYPE